MMRPAYWAWLAGGAPFTADETAAFERAAKREGLTIEPIGPRLLLAATEGATIAQHGWAIVGRIHPRSSAALLKSSDEPNAGLRDPAKLMADHWGSYIGFADDPADPTPMIARAPFGDLPCFWRANARCAVAASSLRLLAAASGDSAPAIDWTALGHYLLATELRRGPTCLAGVHELSGGNALAVRDGAVVPEAHWSPWDFTQHRGAPLELAEAEDLVGGAVDLAIAGATSEAPRSLLLLSGGLDSSLVAAALARAKRDFTCLNMVASDHAGDERAYARAVASWLNAPLEECLRETATINWRSDAHRRLPYPAARLFRQPTEQAARALAARYDASVILDGGGGDNLFCSLQSVAPLVDRLRREGWGWGRAGSAWQTARALALLSEASLVTVLRAAVARMRSGRIAYRWGVDRDFLVPDIAAQAAAATDHPWLQPPPGTLPGQAAHVGLVLAAASLAESPDPEEPVPFVAPLVAQPVVEAVLQLPTWLWFAGARNRVVIRRAFAGRLPEATLARQGKGTPAGFMAEIFLHERARLQALLLDGELVRHGLLDRPAAEAYLADPAPPRDHGFARILQLADAEMWARSWV